MAEAEVYSEVVGGSLKLKGLKALKKKKKKNKAKEVLETIEKVEERKDRPKDSRTPAQKAFDDIQKKRQKERILSKAKKTHKQRVEELNAHLDTLTEHYDIPKVSWTK